MNTVTKFCIHSFLSYRVYKPKGLTFIVQLQNKVVNLNLTHIAEREREFVPIISSHLFSFALQSIN